MNFRQTLAAVSLALALAGCASYSSSYQSADGYRDGSYYSRADDNHGDYYYAPEPRAGYYDYYGQDFFYGGGYCPVRYRYCPPFWYSRYDPWGGGFGDGYFYPSPYYSGGRRHGGHERDHAGDRDRGQRRARALPPGPAANDGSGRARYPDAAPARPRPPSRFVAPEPRRAAPAPEAQRRPGPDAASRAEDRRESRHRRQGE